MLLEHLDSSLEQFHERRVVSTHACDVDAPDTRLGPSFKAVRPLREVGAKELQQRVSVKPATRRFFLRTDAGEPENPKVRLEGLRFQRTGAGDGKPTATGFGRRELIVPKPLGKAASGLDATFGKQALHYVARSASVKK